MAETLVAIDEHLAALAPGGSDRARIVVWAHNTHAGDARATQSGEQGEHNVGQLLRERFDGATMLVGFFTHHGQVMAANTWGAPGEVMNVRPALRGSYADLFHAASPGNFLLTLRQSAAAPTLNTPRLERAIDVIYLPSTERQGHYFLARLAGQFDAVVHLDATGAITPLP